MPYKHKEQQEEYKKKWQKINKQKVSEYGKKYTETHPWMRSYKNARLRCTCVSCGSYQRYGGKGIKFRMSSKDFKQLWFRDKAYEMDRPSIDRIDNNGNYEISNCRYLELSENSKRIK